MDREDSQILDIEVEMPINQPSAVSSSPPVSSVDTYNRNPENDSSLGQAFEANVAIYSILTLRNDGQQLAFESQTSPAKFDDVVLRIRNGSDYEYTYCQLKHRDTDKIQDAYLTWNDLLTAQKSKFGIPFYYDCLAQPRMAALRDVKELVFVTNNNLVVHSNAIANNLENLAQSLFSTGKKFKAKHYYINTADLNVYFQEHSDESKWRPPSSSQKRYKFTTKAIDAIFKGTLAGFQATNNKSFDSSAYKEFLGLLVFRVSVPHVKELEQINQQLLRVFLPFYGNLVSDHYEHVKSEFMHLFKPLSHVGAGNTSGQVTCANAAGNARQKTTACWATIKHRQAVLEKLAGFFKTKVSIGSRVNYETDVLTPYYEQLLRNGPSLTENTSPWAIAMEGLFTKFTSWTDMSPLPIVNIYSNKSIATGLSLSLLSFLNRQGNSKKPVWKTLIDQVLDEASIKNVVEYFRKLENDVTNYTESINTTFIYVIEVSPFFQPADKIKECVEKMTRDLINLSEVRKWIQFVLVTNSSATAGLELLDGLKRVQGNSFNWRDLSDGGKKYLFEKSLHLGCVCFRLGLVFLAS